MRVSRHLRRLKLSRGKVIVLTALLMPVIVGGLALSVDTAVLAEARDELQTAADAAALAGAMQLADDNRLTGTNNISTEMSNARTRSIAIGAANNVLNAAAVINDNPSNTTTGDIVIGYISPTDTSNSAPDTTQSQSMYNSVMVLGSRDSNHGGTVPGFFGAFQGIRSSTISVSATAIVWPYSISGFASNGNQNTSLLPIVLDVTTWNAMQTRDPTKTTDNYTWNPSTQTITSGPDGVYESNLYPVGTDPGNWGTVKIGVSNNSTSTLAAQIQYGITPAQMANYPNSTLSLDTSLTPPSVTLGGNPGISAGIKSAIDAIYGKPVTIPIYDITGGNGNNAWYRIIGFGGVRIMDSNFQGNPKYVIVQPALVNDSQAIPGSPQSGWTAGGVIRLRLCR